MRIFCNAKETHIFSKKQTNSGFDNIVGICLMNKRQKDVVRPTILLATGPRLITLFIMLCDMHL